MFSSGGFVACVPAVNVLRHEMEMTPRFRQHLDKAPIEPSRPTCFKINLRSGWHDQHSAPDVSPDNAHYYWIPQLKSPIPRPAGRTQVWGLSGSVSPTIIWEFLVGNYYNTKTGAGSQWKIWGESDMKDYLVKESKYYSNNFSSSGN